MVMSSYHYEPGYSLLGLLRDGYLWRESEGLPPVHHLAIRLLRVFAAEWRVACDKTYQKVTQCWVIVEVFAEQGKVVDLAF